MEYSECKVGQKVWIRSVKDLRNEFDNRHIFDDDFMYAMFDYSGTMLRKYGKGILGEIVDVLPHDINTPIKVKTEYDGSDDIWAYKPEGLYLKEDV